MRNIADTTAWLKNKVGAYINPATEDTVSQLVMAINNAIDEKAYDLNAAAFSETTVITNDYILDNVEINFTTTSIRDIIITSFDGTVLLEDKDNIDKDFIWSDIHMGFGSGENINIDITQTGSVCSADVILRIQSGTNTLSGNPTVRQADNYFGEVALGSISGRSVVNKFGHTENVTTDLTDIWNDGGIYVFPSSATTMTLSSTDANDTIAGTGARTVEIQGLDTNYSQISETLEMDGLNGVTSDKSYLRVYRMKVMAAGTTGWNEGNIYLGTGAITDGIPAVIHAEITIDAGAGVEGENQTLMAIYTVPAGKTGLIWNLDVATSLDKPVEVWLKVRPFGEVFQTKIRTELIKNHDHTTKKFPIKVTEKSDIRVSARTDTQTTDLSASFDIELVTN